jgi:hypothetical protein
MNKHILMVMDKEYFTKDELENNKESAYYAATYATYTAYAVDAADAADADDYWVDMYFKKTGENKQDYIDEIKRVKESVKEKALEYTQAMADNGVFPSVGMMVRCSTNEHCQDSGYMYHGLSINGFAILESISTNLLSKVNLEKNKLWPLTPPIELTDKEKAIELYITQQPPLTVNEAELIKNAFSAGAAFKPLTVESSFIQTLAQAYEFCGGEVPHRHNDVLIGNLESNIIVFVTPCIKNLFYLTFPKDRVIPAGFKYFCTVEEFMDFVPLVKLIDGKAYQFDFIGCAFLGFYHEEGSKFTASKSGMNSVICRKADCTNIQPLTVEVK